MQEVRWDTVGPLVLLYNTLICMLLSEVWRFLGPFCLCLVYFYWKKSCQTIIISLKYAAF